MTAPPKKYQNVSFQELILFSKNNPNRLRVLDSIEIQAPTTIKEPTLDKLLLSDYAVSTMDPGGILSVLLFIEDPAMYQLGAKNIRTQLLMDSCTKLQEETEDLKNTHLSRKRRKVYDLIGAVYNGGLLQEKEYADLYQGISYLRNIHFILVRENDSSSSSSSSSSFKEDTVKTDGNIKGHILFSSDPTCWKSENPIWVIDEKGRWVANPVDESIFLKDILGRWLVDLEQSGWIVQWPEIDATKTDLVAALSVLPTWQETDKKLTKDILAHRLGRAQTLQLFVKFGLKA
jgi:hypothetical protein